MNSMYLTVDCAQFEGEKLAFYEFCNIEMLDWIDYSLQKFNLLSGIADITYLINYSFEQSKAEVYQLEKGFEKEKTKILDGGVKDFNEWYF